MVTETAGHKKAACMLHVCETVSGSCYVLDVPQRQIEMH